jgi:hypothetical protein
MDDLRDHLAARTPYWWMTAGDGEDEGANTDLLPPDPETEQMPKATMYLRGSVQATTDRLTRPAYRVWVASCGRPLDSLGLPVHDQGFCLIGFTYDVVTVAGWVADLRSRTALELRQVVRLGVYTDEHAPAGRAELPPDDETYRAVLDALEVRADCVPPKLRTAYRLAVFYLPGSALGSLPLRQYTGFTHERVLAEEWAVEEYRLSQARGNAFHSVVVVEVTYTSPRPAARLLPWTFIPEPPGQPGDRYDS